MIKKTMSLFLIAAIGCSSIQRPQTSSLEYPVATIPATHESEFNSVLDASVVPISDASTLFSLPEGSRIIAVREGGTAPYSGVLFNNVAAAGLEVEIRAQQRTCQVNSLYERQQLAATAIRDIESLRNTISTQQRTYSLLIENRNRTIFQYETYSNSLRRQTEGEVGRIVGFTIGGIVLGTVVTGLIVGFFPRN